MLDRMVDRAIVGFAFVVGMLHVAWMLAAIWDNAAAGYIVAHGAFAIVAALAGLAYGMMTRRR